MHRIPVLIPIVLLAAAASTAPVDPPVPGIPGQKGPLPAQAPMVVREMPGGVAIGGGGLQVNVGLDPLTIEVARASDGRVLLESAAGAAGGFSPVAFTTNDGATWNTFYWGYRGYAGVDRPWAHGLRARLLTVVPDRVTLAVEMDAPLRGELQLVVGPFWQGSVRIAVSVERRVEPVNRIAMSFRSPAAEHFAGFGERFNAVDQRGRDLQCWSEEGSIELGWLRPFFPFVEPEYQFPGGVTTTYTPIPFFMSSAGYGVLADVPEPTHFDLGKTQPDTWRVQAEATQLSVVVFEGTPAEALARYTERTGRSLVPRPWMLAPWNQMSNYSQGSSMEVARKFRELDIPSSVHGGALHFLPGGDERGREDALIAENASYHALGYKAWAYFNPRVDRDMYQPLWDEGVSREYFYKAPDGSPYLLDVFGSQWFKVSEVDFTRPGASAWYQALLAKAVRLGFDGWMYDFGEYVPPDALFADGHDGQYWHNPYALIYQQANFEYFRTLDDDPADEMAPDYVSYHRAGYAGSQGWSWAMWGGDASCSWSVADGLPAAVTGGINSGLSGMPFWGSDIGGYHAILVPPTDKELLARWMEFGAFCGLMRDETGGLQLNGARTQILDDPQLTAIVRRYQKLRTQLVPYLGNAAREAHATGLPIMRAALLHDPDDPEVWSLKREFFCGPDLYVAPVVSPGETYRILYLPRGNWIELWRGTEYDEVTGGFRLGGRRVTGGRTLLVDAPLDEAPLFVRAGAVIPLVDARVDTFAPASPTVDVDVVTAGDLAHRLHAWAFPVRGGPPQAARLADGSQLRVWADGAGVHAVRTGVADSRELSIQALWPASLPPPTSVPGLAFVPVGDPLTLAAGTWTYSPQRQSVAVHGSPGQVRVDIAP